MCFETNNLLETQNTEKKKKLFRMIMVFAILSALITKDVTLEI